MVYYEECDVLVWLELMFEWIMVEVIQKRFKKEVLCECKNIKLVIVGSVYVQDFGLFIGFCNWMCIFDGCGEILVDYDK